MTLWSPDASLIDADGRKTLQEAKFRQLAMANPELAPYGAAARRTLLALGLHAALRARIVTGENIGQAHALVATGNAEIGLVALSHVLSSRNRLRGSRWDVPERLHDPIRQDAVLLHRGRNNAAARAFLGLSPDSRSPGNHPGFRLRGAMILHEPGPLLLTLLLAASTTVILLVLGTPLAWWLTVTRSRLKPVVEAVTALPLVLPPTVLGFYLLVVMSPASPVGKLWSRLRARR